MIGITIDKIEIGDFETLQKKISENDVFIYAGLTGDLNPSHLNDQEAKKSIFKKPVAHGMLTAGLISAVLGTKLPGPGTIYLEQYLSFKQPVFFGDTITAKVTILEKNTAKNIVTCETICYNQNNEVVLTGNAKVMPPK